MGSTTMSPPSFPVVLLLLLLATIAAAAGSNMDEEVVDDLQYLIDNSDDIPTNDPDGWPEGDYDDDDLLFQDQDQDLTGHQPEIDETHVVVLAAANFSSFLASSHHVMVEFYAPWCGHCQELAPDYAAAAAHLAAHHHQAHLALAKVDATEETDLAQKYDVQGFPTILFFIDGVPRGYNGARTKEAIVDWINKKLGPAVQNVTSVDEAQSILTGDDKAVLAFLDTLSGAHSDELAAASRLEDSINFYQTSTPDVAKLFHIDAAAKRPSVVLLKKEEEKLTFYDGEFKASAIAGFVSANKLPLVTTLTQETSPSIFGNPIKKQACHILLFAVASESTKFLPIFKEAAKPFKGKLLFVFVERDSEEVGEPVADYFGITGQETTVLAYTGNEDARKFFLDGEVSLEAIKDFAEGFLEDKLTPFYKSEPVPESNDGDVKIVVGKNLDLIVFDETKDVLLESDGYPTILFYPAGKKSFEPITFEGERTVVDLYKFIKKHASIPFKLKRQESRTESTRAEGVKSSGTNSKDEL
ncbi:protein disulfide isomerase3 [Zea mays]|uniref:protein disulfide-isomerase n=1 Tax=Zea mays TaxID=4577 RepID=A0A1D6QVG0_MAIZE|nr:protein disulfide isomerase3 [Zea mays]